jgi:hypothetical protein
LAAANGLDAGTGQPSRHRQRHAEIVMLPCWSFIDHTAIALVGVRAPRVAHRRADCPAINEHSKLMVTQLCQQKFEQGGAADIVDRSYAILDPPMFEGRASVRTTDLHANDAAAQQLKQGFTLTR